MFVQRRFLITMLCLLGLVGLGGLAHADVIIDTGDAGNMSWGFTLDSTQSLAGEFSLSQAYTITSIETWVFELLSGNMTVAIYGDGGGGVPDTGNELFNTSFYADGPDDMSAAWVGPQGLSWDLGPGTYWAAFEVSPSSYATFAATRPVPFPLADYAYTDDGTWYNDGYYPLEMGLRIEGTTGKDVVPEPATISLCGLGLLGLAGRAYRGHKRS